MSRYRNYGRQPGTRTYLSRREEYTLTDEEKHAAYLKRQAAAAAAKKAGVGRPLVPYRPAGPTASEIARAMAEEQALAAAQRAARAAPVPLVPQSVPQPGDIFACLGGDEEEEEAGEAPAP
jgi:hypothetical protein